jgi:hypothetical protein
VSEHVLQQVTNLIESPFIGALGKLIIALGLAGSVWGLWQQKRVLQTYVALDFFKRYDAWLIEMPEVLRSGSSLTSLDEPTRRSVLQAVLRYANLCSEEFALHRRGRVPHDVYSVWAAGMRSYFERPIWRECWGTVRNQYDAYPDFKRYVDGIVRGK